MTKKTSGAVKKGGVQKIMIVLEVGQLIKTPTGTYPIKSIRHDDDADVFELGGREIRITRKPLHEHLADMANMEKLTEKAGEGLHIVGTALDEVATGLASIAKRLQKDSKKKNKK